MNRKRFFVSKLGLLVIVILALVFMPQCQKQSQKIEKKINVLAVLPLTGTISVYGDYAKNGFDLYLKAFPNSKVSISYIDSQGNPKVAISALTQELIKRKPDVVVTTVSHISGAIIPILEEKGIFTILTLSSSNKIMIGTNNVQRINPSLRDSDEPIALFAKKRFNRIAILYSNEEWGISSNKYFTSTYSDEEHSVILSDAYSLSEKDVQTLVQKAISQDPDAIFVTGIGPAYIAIMKNLKTLGYKGKVLSNINFSIPNVVKNIGDAADGVIFTGTELTLSEISKDSIREFAENYLKKFGHEPIYATACCYDMLSILDKMASEGITPSRKAFTVIKYWNGIAHRTEFLSDGECRIPMITILRDGNKNIQVQ